MRIRSTLIAFAATGSLLLGACHKQQPQQPSDNQQTEAPAPVEQTQAPAPEAPPPPKPIKPKPKAAPKPSADQQMLDDADATGMTSHTSSDDGASGAGDNSQQ